MPDKDRNQKASRTASTPEKLPERLSAPLKAPKETTSSSSTRWPRSHPSGPKNPFASASAPKADRKWNPKGSSVDSWDPKGGPKKIIGSIMADTKGLDTSSKIVPPVFQTKSTSTKPTPSGLGDEDLSSESEPEGQEESETLRPSFTSVPKSERAFRDMPLDPEWAPSIHSFDSEPFWDPKGDRRWYKKKTNTRKHQELVESIENSTWYDSRYRVLMLQTGQGGTFGFGDRYMTETGEWVLRKDARETNAKTKHLDCWGRNINAIGTEYCVTCLGVYFELKGNRVFATHINAWHSACSWSEPAPERESAKWWDMRNAIFQKMTRHAAEYNWTRDDVVPGTIRFCSPYGHKTDWVVLQAVCQDFLQIPEYPLEMKAHGFVLRPGQRKRDGSQKGHTLEIFYPHELGVENGLGFRNLSRKWEILQYTDKNGDLPAEWTYTVNIGWHVLTPERGRFEFLHHGLHQLEGTPVYSSTQS